MTDPWPVIAVDELGQRHGPFAAAVRDELLRMGIMWKDKSGEYHIRSAEKDIVAQNPHIAVCDICSASPVTWDADVKSFWNVDQRTGPYALFHSEDGFYLCEPCGQYVLAGDRAGLYKRQLREFMRRWSAALPLEECLEMRVIMEGTAAQMHAQFWENFRGIKKIGGRDAG